MPQPSAEELLVLNSVIYVKNTNGEPSSDGLVEDKSVYTWANRLANDPAKLNELANQGAAEITPDEFKRIVTTIQQNPQVYDQMMVHDVTATPSSPNSSDPDKANDVSVNATISYGGQPIILYKGTSGDSEWRDNGEGGYAGVTDTMSQQAALDYFKQQMTDFPAGAKAVVSGHSKGGNKAQYVTLLAGDQVDHTYSFDGQGFNRAFLLKYADLIEQNGGKITSVSNQNDFVNILFTPVPGSNRLYTNNSFFNTWSLNPLEALASNFKRWHSPATMFDKAGNQVILDLSDARSSPGSLMTGVDDFTEFAQAFMSQEDFAYFCYFAMSQLMGEDANKYGEVLTEPDGFKQRFLSLLKNYLDLKGIDPQEIMIKAPGLGAMVGTLTGHPVAGLFGGAATGAALTLLLAATPSTGYNTTPRDFREEVRTRLLNLVIEVEEEPWWDVTKWDVWYRIDHAVLGGVDFPADEAQRGTYYRKMIDMNGTSKQDVERIFTDVHTAANSFASKVDGWTEKAQSCVAQIRAITTKIPGQLS